MTLTFSIFSFAHLFRPTPKALPAPKADPVTEIDQTLADRAFMHELMSRNPEGVGSEIGLMSVMSQYPGQF